MKSIHLLLVALACLTHTAAGAVVIYQENFDGAGSTNLAGLAPDVAPGSETWGGATDYKADGFVGGFNFSGIYLPFTPSVGTVYTLTGSFRVTAGSDWLGLGYAGGSPTSPVRLSNNQGRGWLIAKDTILVSFIGPGDGNGVVQGTNSTQNPVGVLTTQTITLDASSANPANWTFSATQTVGSTSYTVWTNQPAGITSIGDITAIGLSASTASGTFTNLTLTAVPEPSTYAMALVAVACGASSIWRRRVSSRRR